MHGDCLCGDCAKKLKAQVEKMRGLVEAAIYMVHSVKGEEDEDTYRFRKLEAALAALKPKP